LMYSAKALRPATVREQVVRGSSALVPFTAGFDTGYAERGNRNKHDGKSGE